MAFYASGFFFSTSVLKLNLNLITRIKNTAKLNGITNHEGAWIALPNISFVTMFLGCYTHTEYVRVKW